MAGYMGLGLQKWIYRQWPKRFFKLDRKPINAPIEAYPTKKWELRFPPNKDYARLALLMRNRTKDENYSHIIIALCSFALIFFIILIAVFDNPHFNNYPATRKFYIEHARKEKFEAYHFLLRAGKIATEKNKFSSAHYEFELANKLFPKAIYHHVELANMYVLLCKNEDLYCEETKTYIFQLEKKYCDHPYLDKIHVLIE